MKGFKERLIELMRTSKYTQRELARMVGVTESAMSQYISGDREPKIGVVANLATALNTTTDYLLNGDTEDKKDFETVYRFVTRSSSEFTDEEKLKLIKVLSK